MQLSIITTIIKFEQEKHLVESYKEVEYNGNNQTACKSNYCYIR